MAKYIVLAFIFVAVTGSQTGVDNYAQSLGFYYVGSVDGKSFFADRTWLIWADAKQSCKDAGMRLASISSEEQLNLLSESYEVEKFDGPHWISGRDALDARQYAWDHDNASVDTSFFTIRNKPSLSNCLGFHSSNGSGGYPTGVYVRPCTDRRYPICEIQN